jgi:hypothetical protein
MNVKFTTSQSFKFGAPHPLPSGKLISSTESIMSNFLPFNCNQHLEYHPIQLVPPLSHHVQPSNVPSQQHLQPQPRSIQPSPQPNEQSISQSQTPIPTPGLIYPQSPFEWVLSSITALLQTHHQSVVSKLNETVDQQKSLASKIATLQQTTETLQQTVNTIQADMQGVSAKVARLGADMSSRDATLAGRLNALDDAIEACISDGKLAGASVSGAHGALQTPPASDVQPTDPGSQPGAPEPQPQQEDTIAQEIADHTALSTRRYKIMQALWLHTHTCSRAGVRQFFLDSFLTIATFACEQNTEPAA